MNTTTLQQDIETGTPSGHVTDVTPEMAAAWLELNAKNRNVRQADVNKYARDMAAGHWQMTGEAIKFSTNGILLDGQHRLWAIVESGQNVRMMVVTGLTPESQSVMDSGAKRSAGDSLHLAGIQNANLVAAAARLGLAFDAGYLTRARTIVNGQDVPTPTHAEVRQWVDLNPNVVDCVRETARWKGRSKAAASSALLITKRIDPDEASHFFTRVTELDFRGKGDPAKALYERLLTSQTNRERMSNVTEMHLIFRAWNAERDGQQLSKMAIRSSATPFEVPR